MAKKKMIHELLDKFEDAAYQCGAWPNTDLEYAIPYDGPYQTLVRARKAVERYIRDLERGK